MEKISDRVAALLKSPEDYLRPNGKLRAAWVEHTKAVYKFIKDEEERHNLPAPQDALPELYTDGLDLEQIWQLVELQNKSLLAAPDDLDGLNDTNLCYMVAKLSSLTKFDRLTLDTGGKSDEEFDEGWDEGIGGSSDEDDREEDKIQEEVDNVLDSPEDNKESENEDENLDEDLLGKPKELEDTELDDEFGDDSDDEVDNFDELFAKEGKSSDEDDEYDTGRRNVEKDNDVKENTNLSDDDVPKKPVKNNKIPELPRDFRKTKVDTSFFKLRESEWVADNDMIGENYTDDYEDINMMADISDGNEEEEGVMYDAFFDGAPDSKKDKKEKSKPKKLSAMLDDDDMEESEEDDMEESEDDEGKSYHDDKTSRQVEEEVQQDDEDEEVGATQLLGTQKKEVKSTFEKEREQELMLMEMLEENNVSDKPWHLRGEVASAERPENSALEEQMDYDIAVRHRPTITEDTTSLVEKIILGRIRTKAWDDVERKIKPTADPFEYKKRLLLDQDKNKKSLAEIYEEEYVKQQKETEHDQEEELPEHKEIKERMDKLFTKLDALSNFHYIPSKTTTEVKIQSNLPAITVEEVTPATATDASLLAPQEVLEPVKGELQGDTERSSTDKKRDRRIKKAHQKKKAKLQEVRLKEKLKKTGKGGRLDAKSTVKMVEKAVKAGQVKMLEEKDSKVVRSSEKFFRQLQDSKTENSKEKKQGLKKKESNKQRRRGGGSASKLLL